MKAKKLVTYRLDADLVDRLKLQAEREQRTITAVVERSLSRYLDEEDKRETR